MTADRKPLVSVVIPTYNYGRFLGDAISSVLSQTIGDVEVIVIDDGSTDETPEVLTRAADPRVVGLRQSNSGVSVARNLGLERARGSFLAFLDADDLWRPDYLERQLSVLDAEPEVVFCFSNFVRRVGTEILPTSLFDFCPALRQLPARPSTLAHVSVIEGDVFSALIKLGEGPAWLQATVYRRDRIADLRFTPGLALAEDLHFQARAYLRGAVAYIDLALVEVRRHDHNSYTSSDVIREAVLRVVRQLEQELDLTAAQRGALHRRIGHEHSSRGYRYFWAHQPAAAARHYFEALRWPGSRTKALAHLAAIPVLTLLPRREPEF